MIYKKVYFFYYINLFTLIIKNYIKKYNKNIYIIVNFQVVLMAKKILLHIPDDIYETIMMLKNQTLQEDELIFFSNHTGTDQSWLRYILQMGVIKTKQDFEKFKKFQDTI